MKKLAIALAALAVAATVASAAVYSQNAVGFINVEVGTDELVALTFPFNEMNSTSGTVSFNSTQLAADAARGSTAYFWTGTGWDAMVKGRSTWPHDYQLKPGEMFFFQPATNQVVVMNGEVPDEASFDISVKGAENLSAIGNPYPVETKFTDTTLATTASRGATVYFWTTNGWDAVVKPRGAFETDKVLAPGEGFFFQTVGSDAEKIWTVTKEYDYP